MAAGDEAGGAPVRKYGCMAVKEGFDGPEIDGDRQHHEAVAHQREDPTVLVRHRNREKVAQGQRDQDGRAIEQRRPWKLQRLGTKGIHVLVP